MVKVIEDEVIAVFDQFAPPLVETCQSEPAGLPFAFPVTFKVTLFANEEQTEGVDVAAVPPIPLGYTITALFEIVWLVQPVRDERIITVGVMVPGPGLVYV